MELRTGYPYSFKNRYDGEYKTENAHINVAKTFSSFLRKHNRINCGSLHKGFCKLILTLETFGTTNQEKKHQKTCVMSFLITKVWRLLTLQEF